MSNIFSDGAIDRIIDDLDDKIVRTNQGSFIKTDDLLEYVRQVREMEAEEAEKPKPKTFAEAREQAKRDPALQQPPLPPRAPALSSVKGVAQEESNERVAS